MPAVTISPEEDKRLERAVPVYLRGNRNATKRVRFAIHEIVKRAEEEQDGQESKHRSG